MIDNKSSTGAANLEIVIRRMKPSDLVFAMVEGLQADLLTISMDTYGEVSALGDCIGCAATAAILNIAHKPANPSQIRSRSKRARYLGVTPRILADIEWFFDALRRGDLPDAKFSAQALSLATPFSQECVDGFSLPGLTTGNYKTKLQEYYAYGQALAAKGL